MLLFYRTQTFMYAKEISSIQPNGRVYMYNRLLQLKMVQVLYFADLVRFSTSGWETV